MHIPFACMVELKFPAHLPVDHLADPVMSRLILQCSTFFIIVKLDLNRNKFKLLIDLCISLFYVFLSLRKKRLKK